MQENTSSRTCSGSSSLCLKISELVFDPSFWYILNGVARQAVLEYFATMS